MAAKKKTPKASSPLAPPPAVLSWVVVGQGVKFGRRWYAQGETFHAQMSKVRWLAETGRIVPIPDTKEG